MGGMEAIGWLAAAWMGQAALPAAALDKINDAFAYRVDHNDSCWDRIGGVHGAYGKPGDYSLDLLCNWRLKKVATTGEITEWQLVRDD
jgi:hypothetical protein